METRFIAARTTPPVILPTTTDFARLSARSIIHNQFVGLQWYLMLSVAFLLLCVCFLIAGLTLGVCGLDARWLEMQSLTGTSKERQQALVILRMKRHHSWMLCSLILCSVACGEYLPFVIEDLCGTQQKWVPILISTLLLAVCAEIIPQWLIPQQAISWGYYCWPLIWGCMWLTALISYPIGWLLDGLASRNKENLGVFTNEQLAVIIKHHETTEKRGGNLSPEATRIMLGVLNNEDRQIGGDIAKRPRGSDSSKDIEKGTIEVTRGVIVKWSSVKMVDIDEVVDKEFIDKILGWSYSRIPVVGKQHPVGSDGTPRSATEWEGIQVFGFLHIKIFIGMDLSKATPEQLFVRDLPLYPLPIITDEMSVYELLYMFQLGMSRIAIVVPASSCLGNAMQDSSIKGPTFWTGTKSTNAKIAAKMADSEIMANWETDYVAAAQFCGQRVTGIRTPKPIGIVTFEDIIDSLLQRTSHDETDFFDRKKNFPPTKSRKSGDGRPPLLKVRHATTLRSSVMLLDSINQVDAGSFRQRNGPQANLIAGFDGADEASSDSFELKIIPQRRALLGSSSYTDNTQGGFHYKTIPLSSIVRPIPEPLVVSITPTAPTTLNPSLDNEDSTPDQSQNNVPESQAPVSVEVVRRPSIAVVVRQSGRRYVSASPCVPDRTLPSAGRVFSSLGTGDNEARRSSTSLPPTPTDRHKCTSDSALELSHLMRQYIRLHSTEESDVTEDTVSLSSWGGNGVQTPVYDAGAVSEIDDIRDFFIGQDRLRESTSHGKLSDLKSAVTLAPSNKCSEPYSGFPLELLESNKENYDPTHSSKTMPRMTKPFDDSVGYSSGRDTMSSQQAFREDQKRFPQQRRPLTEDVFNGGGNRTSSMWF